MKEIQCGEWTVKELRDGRAAIVDPHGYNAGNHPSIDAAQAALPAAIAVYQQQQAQKAAADAARLAERAAVTEYHLYAADASLAGVPVGVDGTFVTTGSLRGGWTKFGGGRYADTFPSGTKVCVRWGADKSGCGGYGPNRQLRGSFKIVA